MRLREQVSLTATALRDGLAGEIPASRLVPGDVVLLSAGDLVPADCRLLEARDFYVNEALLTGEAYPTEKEFSDAPAAALLPRNAVFMGCFGPERDRPGAGGRDRPVHGTWRDRRHAAQTAAGNRLCARHSRFRADDPAADGLAGAFRAAHQSAASPSAAAILSVCPGSRRGPDTGTAPDDRVGHPGARRDAALPQGSHRQAAFGNSRSGQHGHPMQRQDRDPHRSRHQADALDRPERYGLPRRAEGRFAECRVRDRTEKPARQRHSGGRHHRLGGMEEAGRNPVRLRAPARIGSGRGRRHAPDHRQGRGRRHSGDLHAVRARRACPQNPWMPPRMGRRGRLSCNLGKEGYRVLRCRPSGRQQ